MRRARILFPMPLPEAFDYEVPDLEGDLFGDAPLGDVPLGEVRAENRRTSEGLAALAPGDFVRAELGRTERLGVVWSVDQVAGQNRPLKPVLDRLDAPPLPEVSRRFVTWVARYVCASPGAVLRMVLRAPDALEPSPVSHVLHAADEAVFKSTPAREAVLAAARARPGLSQADLARFAGVSAGVVAGLVKAGGLVTRAAMRDLPFEAPDPSRQGPTLSPDQAAAVRVVRAKLGEGGFTPILIDGVTGSGKTEVYFEAIADLLRAEPEAQILVLLPEIALTEAVIARFEARFGARPAGWHTDVPDAERRRVWREVIHGRARIVLGARSALFLPFANLRLVVVDEEHDTAYKQEEGVIYNGRDLAVMRAKMSGAGVILASATPALETLENARSGRYAHVRLAARPGAAVMPEIDLIDLRADPPDEGRWLSPRLIAAMQQTYKNADQTLLYLNRRGFAPLVLCRACGEKLKSPHAETWLTEHRYSGRLVCHLTGYSMPRPAACPHCHAEGALVSVGPGVERIADEVRVILPGARVEILSSDTASTPAMLRALIGDMEAGRIDVLVGTQMAAKGHNFPHLTLVGVVDADAGLKGGDLRAGERTWSLLSQVAGRAGRAEQPGRALVQTWDPDNPVFAALKDQDRDSFFALEADQRAALGQPPFGRLAALIVSAAGDPEVDAACALLGAAIPKTDGIDVFGPALPQISVLRGRHRRRFLVRADRGVDLSAFMATWRARTRLKGAARAVIDIDPQSFL
jgi:primosomal protein N' (replication factor Y) (superfamily II helicase)